MCGIIGIVGNPEKNIATSLYDGLLVLQHRGQDAAGIITSNDDYIFHRRANGLVRDVTNAIILLDNEPLVMTVPAKIKSGIASKVGFLPA